MNSYTRTIVNLKVLSCVQDHDKVIVDGGLFSIQRVPKGRLLSLWNWFTRTMTSQSRSHTLEHLNHLCTDCERLVDDRIIEEIPGALRGIESLRRTYNGDVSTVATLEFVSARLRDLQPASPESPSIPSRLSVKRRVRE